MRKLTVNLDLEGAAALLLGCGKVGRRKLDRLLGTGARIAVVEPSPSPELERLAEEGRIALYGSFCPELLDGCRVALVATDAPVPPEILSAASEGRLLLNAAVSPGLGNFTLPAVCEDGELSISVSTGGSFPALSAAVAERLRESFRGWGGYLELLGRLRPLVLGSGLGRDRTRAILKRLAADGELPALVCSGLPAEALDLARGLVAPVEIPGSFAWPAKAAGPREADGVRALPQPPAASKPPEAPGASPSGTPKGPPAPSPSKASAATGTSGAPPVSRPSGPAGPSGRAGEAV
ncbi:MAG: hypothetical protein LBQ12_06885 [Deltaproteobacteria bacterium]|nr:hypothetical protein [Deltaproteobacteria bacterium]